MGVRILTPAVRTIDAWGWATAGKLTIPLGIYAAIAAMAQSGNVDATLSLAAGPVTAFLLGLFVRTRIAVVVVVLAGLIFAGMASAPDAEYTEMDDKTQVLLTLIFFTLPTLVCVGAGALLQRGLRVES